MSVLHPDQFGKVDTWVPSQPRTSEQLAQSRAGTKIVDQHEYHVARHNEVIQQEDRTRGGRGEVEHEKATGVKQPLTYKDWMKRGSSRYPG